MVASFLTLLALQTAATVNGMVGGQYSVVAETNVLGENYVELVLEILAVPAILWASRRFVVETLG